MFFIVLLFLWNDKECAHAMQGCGSVVNNTLKSPGYPGDYPNNMDCNYTVPIPPGMALDIVLDYFDLEYQRSCSYDYLQINVKGNQISYPISTLCGIQTGRTFRLRGDLIVVLTFHTDTDTQRKGFNITFKFYEEGCGSVVNNTLKSPGYPNNYPSNVDCVFLVPIPHNLTMKISFKYFELQDHSSCSSDYLEIVNDKGKMVVKYCGLRTGRNVFLTGDQILIKFHSDGSEEKRGFLIYFTAVPHAVPEPVAFYPLNARYKAAEKENRQPRGILGDVTITNGPYNEPGGAYMFYGTVGSYIEFPNKGGLYTRFSITLMCWVQPGGQDGPLYCYRKDGLGVQISIDSLGAFNIIISDKTIQGTYSMTTAEVLPTGVWVHVAATHDHNTGLASLYINGHLSDAVNMPTYAISTNTDEVRMGVNGDDNSYFKGKIAEMKVYDVALNEAQIQASIRQVPPTVTFPAALLAIQGGMLSCLARGTPPMYTALKRNSTVLMNTTNTATIRLYKEGNYTCQATNQYGTEVRELQVSFTTFDLEIGFLTSEGYPISYPRYADNISAYPIPEGWSMNIYFQDFDVEDSRSCVKDFLRITDGMGKTLGVYCGNKTGQNLLVTGDQVEMIFHSDSKIERRGYLLAFTLVSPRSVSHVPTRQNVAEPIQENSVSNERMIYILSGIAFILLLVLCFILGFWCYRRSHHKRMKRSARSVREIIPLDKWELLPAQIEYEEELGRGAFGVVYKATLKRRVGIEVFDTEKVLKLEEPCQVVAVKELQDDPREEQKQEFLQEIEQMKLLGAHQNIVSLVGCCTLQEHKFLVIEYVPFGDLLQWLRRRRRSINRNQGTGGKEKRKCYEDKDTFNAQREMSECGQGERDLRDENRALAFPGGFQVHKEIAMSTGQLSQEKDDTQEEEIDRDQPLLEQTLLIMESTPSRDNRDIILDIALPSENLAEENIELLSMPPTSKGNTNAATMLISTENIDENDDDGEEENSNDFLDQENSELLSMPSTSQGNSNTATILVSTENIENDDDDSDEENSNDFLDQENIELLSMPSTSQGKRNAAAILISTENINDDDDDDDEEADTFTTPKLFSFAWQIARGMNHLAEKDFIHRDLAARNILVGSDNRVKVSDFGLMRQIYQDVYSGKNTKKLPLKWMAPESIFDSIYTIKSDVWSFGVLLWEMATMGGVPYPTLNNSELCRLLKTGYRMDRPDMCCDEVYELMSECWNEDPSSRPSFSELIDRLEVIMTRDVPYCDLNKHDESSPYYNVPAKADEHSA